MKSLLFISPQFHKKTGSNLFIRELYETKYKIDDCFLDWDSFDGVSNFFDKDYDLLICWQITLTEKVINSLSYKRGVFFPMFDACKSVFKTEAWWSYRNFVIISFSLFLHKRLKIIGLDSYYIQYFPKVSLNDIRENKKSVFFWNRQTRININDVCKFFLEIEVNHIHWHKAVDPNQSIRNLNDEYLNHYNLTVTEWFDLKEEMYNCRDNSAYYFAPRRYEGIGHGFLEAMATGRCVVAPNKPTMNEYIDDGENGLLYDPENIKPLAMHNLEDIQRNTKSYMQEGRNKWNRNKSNILVWSEKKGNPKLIILYFWLFIRFLRNPLKVSRYIIK